MSLVWTIEYSGIIVWYEHSGFDSQLLLSFVLMVCCNIRSTIVFFTRNVFAVTDFVFVRSVDILHFC